MGLDISVYKITKEKQPYYFRMVDENLNYHNDFPEWTKEFEQELDEKYIDWDEYVERNRLDLKKLRIVMEKCGPEGYFKAYYGEARIPLTILYSDLKEKIVKIKVLYRKEVGYQRKGLNDLFYDDYCADKIGYFVWSKENLKEYKTKYAENPQYFQENIIDNFDENCVCTFDW